MLILTMCSCILGLCACLNNVSAIRLDWVSTHDAFYLCTTHVHALHVLIPSFLHLNVFVVFLFFSLSLLFGLLIMVSKSSSLPKTRFVMVLLLLLFLLTLFSFVMRRHELTSRRTFLTRQFIQNAKSFYLTFQTLLYPVLLALRDGFLFVRKPRGVPTCS